MINFGPMSDWLWVNTNVSFKGRTWPYIPEVNINYGWLDFCLYRQTGDTVIPSLSGCTYWLYFDICGM